MVVQSNALHFIWPEYFFLYLTSSQSFQMLQRRAQSQARWALHVSTRSVPNFVPFAWASTSGAASFVSKYRRHFLQQRLLWSSTDRAKPNSRHPWCLDSKNNRQSLSSSRVAISVYYVSIVSLCHSCIKTLRLELPEVLGCIHWAVSIWF